MKKPILLTDAGNSDWTLQLKKEVVAADTSYYLEFRDASYPNRVDLKMITFTHSQLKEFGSALSKTLMADYGSRTVVAKATMTKEKGASESPYLKLVYDKALCNLKEKQAKQLIEVIGYE
ncbi:MAG: hypothetical protein ABUM51_05560 [Bacteroidota bacterium]